jgi:Phage tail sheath C-terminal domain/Phage tail sheath protein subtilisin-like domain
MATPQLSPGYIIREVDQTVGRVDNIVDNIGAIAGPFSIGPVEQAVNIRNESELLTVFGKPQNNDAQYEYWLSASSFLTYGGVLKTIRCDGSNLVNANAKHDAVGVSTVGQANLKIKNFDDYNLNYTSDTQTYIFAAKTPGEWANNLKVAIIDDKADQILTVGAAATAGVIGLGVTTPLVNIPSAGVGATSLFNGYLKGIITGVGNSTIDVKITSVVDSTKVETSVTYAERSQLSSFLTNNSISIINSSGVGVATTTASVVKDWYNEQVIPLTNSNIYWKSIAPKPVSNQYALERNSKTDAIHVVVIDDTGSITGIQGNLLEKFVNLSKATDARSTVNVPQNIFWKTYIAEYSDYIYVGDNPSDNSNNEVVYPTGFSSGFTPFTIGQGLWNLPTQSVTFSAIGNSVFSLKGGKDYGDNGGMLPTLANIITSYQFFVDADKYPMDYLIMGPGYTNKIDSQAKANQLISIASQRKDCIATISPHRSDVVGLTNTETQTNNIIEFYTSLSSSSYAVFDTGYKYAFDRFNNRYRYIPCNPDIAGLMIRTNIGAYPWNSPAGQQRGVLNGAINLAYSPNKSQRDRLYPSRINAIVNIPGFGPTLWGDKTALGYASAFDRINVRRLFLTVEQAISSTANSTLFENNTEQTRSNFINIVEPYLRDIQAKGGLYDFRVICDKSNNTDDVIDNNEFRADIYLKPVKAINFVTLTFVATRTGVSFEEVTGRA